MTMIVTDAALSEFLKKDIDWEVDTFRLYLVDSTAFTPGADPNVDDLPGGSVIGFGTIPDCVAVDNTATCGIVPITGLGSGDTVAGMWVARWTGTASTSRLIAFTDRNADTTPIAYTTTGANVNVEFSPYVFSI